MARVSSQPFCLCLWSALTGKDPTHAFDICHRSSFPILFGVPEAVFMKACHSYLDGDVDSCCSRLIQDAWSYCHVWKKTPWPLASFYLNVFRRKWWRQQVILRQGKSLFFPKFGQGSSQLMKIWKFGQGSSHLMKICVPKEESECPVGMLQIPLLDDGGVPTFAQIS